MVAWLKKNEKKAKREDYGKNKTESKKKVSTACIKPISTYAPTNILIGRRAPCGNRRRGGARDRVSSFRGSRGRIATSSVTPPRPLCNSPSPISPVETKFASHQPNVLDIALPIVGSSLPAARASRNSRLAFSFCPPFSISAMRVAFTEPTAKGLLEDV